jgi:hypothetical protein
VVAVVAVVAVDRAVRSAGNSILKSCEHWGRSDAAPVILEFGFARSGFTPKAALPIIAPLGGGPVCFGTRGRRLMALEGLFVA